MDDVVGKILADVRHISMRVYDEMLRRVKIIRELNALNDGIIVQVKMRRRRELANEKLH